MTGHGVSSRSSHSGAAGRMTSLAKPCTQSRRSRWSSLSSKEKPAIVRGFLSGLGNVEQAHEPGREPEVALDLELAGHEQDWRRRVAGGELEKLHGRKRDSRTGLLGTVPRDR